jgi:hypothetical protein
MNTTKSLATLPLNPLDRITMTAFDRLRAEAAISRGEYIAELMLEGMNAVRSLFGNVKGAHRLDPAG